MYPVTSKFLRRIRESGRRKTVVDVYYDGLLVASDIAVSEGTIRLDLEGQVRRTGSITVADPRLVPTLSSTLSPLGTEVKVRQGIVYPNGTEELIPLGVFRLSETSWSALGKIPTIQLYDRSKMIADADMGNYYGRPGKLAKDVILEILRWFYPQLDLTPESVFDNVVTNYRLPGGHLFEQSSHWDAIDELAKNMGGRLYFDVDGFPRVRALQELTSTSTPDLVIDAGGVLVDANRTYSAEGIRNSVTVVGAAATNGAIARGTVTNNDPGSPLRYGGPYGKVCEVISEGSLTTTAQCLARAKLELAKYLGPSYSVDFSSVPNPALDVGDIIQFVFPDNSTEVHQVNTLAIPLGKGSFSGTSKGVYLG